MQVSEFLEDSARLRRAKCALVAGGRRMTYGEMDTASTTLAAALQALGVGRGDRVVIHLENIAEAIISLWATLKAGGIFVMVNPTMKADKLAYIVNDCQACVLISEGRALDVVAEVWKKTPAALATLLAGDAPASAGRAEGGPVLSLRQAINVSAGHVFRAVRVLDVDHAAIVYTSGSTGVPKGVLLSHANIVAASASILSFLENTSDDVILNVLPLSFDYGLYQALMAARVGATLVLERSFTYPAQTLEVLVRERVTGFPIVPTIAAMLVRHDLSAYDLSALRYVSSTGAVLPPSHIATLRSMAPHVKVFSMYGITEAKRVSYLDPSELDARQTSVGRPMDNVEVFVAGEDGQLHETGTGELVVRGATVMQGYWGKPQDTAAVLRPGRYDGERLLYTGDVFRIDDEGYMYFVGRQDDIIKSRGEKVSPREVENVLHDLAGVSEAVVLGIPDAVLGQALKACVALVPGASVTELDVLRHCAGRLEDYMVPKVVEFLPSMPRTSTGKVNRRELSGHAAG